MTADLVTSIASDIDPQCLLYNSETLFSLSLCKIYKSLAAWIRIYGAQHSPRGVQKSQRPLRQELMKYIQCFRNAFLRIPSLGSKFLEIFTTIFLLDSRYSGQLSTNFRGFLRGIGCTIAGDEKLLHCTGRSPDVRVVYIKPDRVGLWIYELCVNLSNDLPYMCWICGCLTLLVILGRRIR